MALDRDARPTTALILKELLRHPERLSLYGQTPASVTTAPTEPLQTAGGSLKCDGPLTSLAITPDGKWLASAHTELDAAGKAMAAVFNTWELATNQRQLQHRVVGADPGIVAFGPDGRLLAM